MKRKAISLALALVMCLGLCVSASAADGDFTIENGVLSKYNGPGGDVIIPDGVTEIGEIAFYARTDLTSVIIPDSVTKIGMSSFYNCTNLTSVTVPSNVTSLGAYSFENCTNLVNITIPSSVIYIGPEAFQGTPWLESQGEFAIVNGILLTYSGPGGSVAIPDGVISIGPFAFLRNNLTSVTIPSSVTEIGDYAFFECNNLTSVTIPDGVTKLGPAAFGNCTNLSDMIIPHSVTKISNSVFGNCISLTNISIPSGITAIEQNAFYNCIRLTSVDIPSSVAAIEQNAFDDCTNLTDIYYGGTKAQWDTIQIDSPNRELTSARIHYASDAQQELPSVAVEDIPASGTAYASTQTVTVDGKAVEFQMYALKDAGGNPTNYIKLRDMAYILNGTKAQFAVGYDGTISLTTGQPYQPGNTEMTTPYSGDRAYSGGAQAVKVNGKDVGMTAITLTDDSGGGYNYFKLRDLGQVLGFNVYWADGQGVSIQTDRPYTGQV